MRKFHGRKGHIKPMQKAGVDYKVVDTRHDGIVFGVQGLKHIEEEVGSRMVQFVLLHGTNGTVKIEIDLDNIGGSFKILKHN